MAGVVEWKDVGVLEVCSGLDLGQEAFGSHDCCEFRLQDLQRDLGLVLQFVGQVARRPGRGRGPPGRGPLVRESPGLANGCARTDALC